jgi:hypothetical protein
MSGRRFAGVATFAVVVASCAALTGCGSTTVVTTTLNPRPAAVSQAPQTAAKHPRHTNPRKHRPATKHITRSSRERHHPPSKHAAPSAVALTCSDWPSASSGTRTGVVQSLVGATNLAFRVLGTTASCFNWTHNGTGNVPTLATVITGIASDWPQPVSARVSQEPPTLSPDDPDQCTERTNAAQGDGTNADYLAQGLSDCLAMGY